MDTLSCVFTVRLTSSALNLILLLFCVPAFAAMLSGASVPALSPSFVLGRGGQALATTPTSVLGEESRS